MEKKCPNCHQWTHWQGKHTDRCEHCNTMLEEQRALEVEEYKQREANYTRNEWFTVKETDNILMIVVRKVGLFFHIVFGAISWFFIWMFVNAAG